MKKEIMVIVVIIVLIVIGHVATQKYTRSFFSEISEPLETIENNIKSGNIDKLSLKKEVNKIETKWEEKYNVCACYIEHDELEKVQTQIVSIKADIEMEEYSRCVEKIENCKFVLKHIEDKDSFEFVNIF